MTMTGIPDEMRRNYNKMKLLADYTKMGVDRRVEALRRFNRQLLSSDKVIPLCGAMGYYNLGCTVTVMVPPLCGAMG